MRLLLYSPAFLPRIGGLEIVMGQLAGELARRGHPVVVVTRTPGEPSAESAYEVVRRPGPGRLLRLVRGCEVFFQANVSLRGLWPLALVRRPWVVSHHSWYCRADGRIAWQDRAKRRLLRRAAASIAVSEAVARDLDVPSVVIGNPYRDELFRRLPGVERDGDLVFLGRLVSDKGVAVLLDALALLAGEGLRPALTIVGDGPERPALEAQARRLGLAPQIAFLGVKTGGELVALLNRHRILVVPSRYAEPFGVVALEGIACGCAVVGSAGGGLPQAIGPCGRTFPNGDARSLARVIGELLPSPAEVAALLSQAPRHLAAHGAARVAERYEAEIERAVARSGRRHRGKAAAP
jgi:glycosyltransferase involved in cell wall biosynthesis